MDIELVNLIHYIQSIKQDLYKKYKPELIDGKNVILSQTSTQNDNEDTPQPKAYIKLIQKQRKLLYGNNFEAQENASKRVEEINKNEKLKITFKNSNNITDNHYELCKPWTKIPNNLKIQSILKFIDSLSPKLTDDQKNQLRYLLISSISQKKITKQGDVDYDSTNGYIIKINKLIFDNKNFVLLEENDDLLNYQSFPFHVVPFEIPTQTKKKLILIKK